ncbi:hypothetical protein RE428_18640 [Marinobacter nanhaiticus D15-8W]|nr:hypothetical protein RE428_18640 [Marinobacter nanhaiticus D15-8W]
MLKLSGITKYRGGGRGKLKRENERKKAKSFSTRDGKSVAENDRPIQTRRPNSLRDTKVIYSYDLYLF